MSKLTLSIACAAERQENSYYYILSEDLSRLLLEERFIVILEFSARAL